jgi:hypothetical protein
MSWYMIISRSIGIVFSKPLVKMFPLSSHICGKFSIHSRRNSTTSHNPTEFLNRVLLEHYGFTPEELDFVINYDIKYRMGADEDAARA